MGRLMKSWLAARTHSMKEQIVEQHLRKQGFNMYLSRFKKSCRHTRKVGQVLVPFFPHYLFDAMEVENTRGRCINDTRGISYLLKNDGLPAEVPEKIVETLKEKETAGGLAFML